MVVEQIKQYLAQLDFGGTDISNGLENKPRRVLDLNQLSTSAYLVGGSVRDGILQRYKTPWDLDFVVSEGAIALAENIARDYHGGFVVLDRDREIARVVFPQGTLDFALQAGKTIEEDLSRRDFTINAIAYNLANQQLVDPLGGTADLQRGILTMVAPDNLDEDPLRLLRAYRQAAQLNLTIDASTRKAIQKRTARLSTIAAERVQAELNYLFTAPQGNRWLIEAIEDGLLNYWLPHITQASLQELAGIEEGINLGLNLGWDIEQSKILGKLATLTATDANIAETELTKLKYSRSQIKTVTKTVKYLPHLPKMINNLSLREQYFWFLAVKDIFPLLILRAIALRVTVPQLQPLIDRYLNPDDPVAHPQPLISGNDLLQNLHLKPSPIIGKLLTELQVAQIEAKITTPQEAIELAQYLLRELDRIGN